MFKKVLSVSLVLFGIVFFQTIEECFANAAIDLEQADTYVQNGQYDLAETAYKAIVTNNPSTNYALEAQKKLVMLYKHEQPQVRSAFQELVTSFSAHQLLAQTVHEIVEHYYETESHNRFEMINWFSQYLVGCWPGQNYEMWGLSGVAISNISLDNDSAAQAAISKLITDFSKNEHGAKAVYDVAHRYNLLSKYDKAKQLYQQVIANWPAAKHTMWVQVDLAQSNIVDGNDTAANAAINELVANVSSEEFIAGALYDIAEHYSRIKRHEKAKQIYQHVVTNKPQDYYAMWAQMGIIVSNISLNDKAAVQTAFNKLVTDFSGNERLADAVYYIGENYKWVGNHEKAKQYYQYVLDHWPKHEHHGIWTQIDLTRSKIALGEKDSAKAIIDELITQLDAGSPYYSHWPAVAGEAYCHAGSCYHLMGEHEKAKDCYEKIINGYPGHRRIEHAQKWLSHYNSK